MTDRRTQISWLPGFILLSAIWGSSFALIKVAVDADVPPLWVALWRCLLGALILGVLFVATGQRLPRSAALWGHVALVAALLNSVPFALLAWGETQVSSLLAGIFNATTPLTTLLFVLALVPGERPGPRRLLGLALGFAGVLVVLGIWHGVHSGTLTGSLACIGATTCYGAGFAYTRRFLSSRDESAIVLSTMQIGCAAAELILVCPAASGAPHWPGVGAGLALLGLGAAGTGIAYVLNFSVIRAAGATVASTVTYVVPVWSTVLGAVALSEPFGPGALVGSVMIICGAALTRPPRPRPAPAVGQQTTAEGSGPPPVGHRSVGPRDTLRPEASRRS
ncbi:DMT family transporter [Frankia sp. CiP3]|uniref:DMT family transporter n=1 Tax=Frankia sp. CiP3 TaxID=2880971 RepID=UPI001EF51ABA|nr:DMT family transporter [Frankia sp. CiP3]